MIKLAVLLGNPDTEYRETRHNAAWMAAECMNSLSDVSWSEKFKSSWTTVSYNQEQVRIIKPLTYMNKSGESVQQIMNFFKISPEEMIVVHDDLETEFGYIGVKYSGGLGGHNGLRSIRQMISTPDFYRLKIGISRPSGGSVSSYVLGKFTKDEQTVLPLILERSAELLENSILGREVRINKKMNKIKCFQ